MKQKKTAATQVSAVMNSYMLPQGARCTASPRVTTATTWASAPSALNPTAARTHGPAAQMAWKAPLLETGRAGTSGAAGPAAAATERPPAEPPTAEPAPTVAS